MTDFDRGKYLVRAVDDDPTLLDAISFALGAEGWHVRTYADPKAFLDELDLSIPGCVILDIKMPEISGPEIHELLNERESSLPVIFLTGHGDMNSAIHAFRSGAFDFLQKPINPNELIRTLEKAIEKEESDMRERTKLSALGRYNSLTEQQRRVILDMAAGLDREAIIEHLGISGRTLQRHRQQAMRKLGIRDPSEVAPLMAKVREEQELSLGKQNPFSHIP